MQFEIRPRRSTKLGSFDREASLLACWELYSTFEVEESTVSAAKAGLSAKPLGRKG
jgi:hypothetical protein